jgi:hypothetical protein
MNFDFGEVLTRAWKITWNHKVLWALSLLPLLIVLLLLPVWLVVVFQREVDFDAISTWMENPTYMSIALIIYLAAFAASLFLQIISRASVTLGIYRAEAALPPMTFVELFRDGFRYFWRVLGIVFLITVGLLLICLVFVGITAALSVVTMGLAALCLQPLFLLIVPLSMLAMAFREQSESAIIADELNVMDAFKRAYELIRSNIWKYVLITLIIYFGMSVLTSLITVPFMLPMFFLMMRTLDSGPDFNSMIRMQAVFGVVILPLMAVIQGFSLTYLKSAMMLTYLRLTRFPQSLPQGTTS